MLFGNNVSMHGKREGKERETVRVRERHRVKGIRRDRQGERDEI
jgi:hypothetical protein